MRIPTISVTLDHETGGPPSTEFFYALQLDPERERGMQVPAMKEAAFTHGPLSYAPAATVEISAQNSTPVPTELTAELLTGGLQEETNYTLVDPNGRRYLVTTPETISDAGTWLLQLITSLPGSELDLISPPAFPFTATIYPGPHWIAANLPVILRGDALDWGAGYEIALDVFNDDTSTNEQHYIDRGFEIVGTLPGPGGWAAMPMVVEFSGGGALAAVTWAEMHWNQPGAAFAIEHPDLTYVDQQRQRGPVFTSWVIERTAGTGFQIEDDGGTEDYTSAQGIYGVAFYPFAPANRLAAVGQRIPGKVFDPTP